MNDHVIRCSVLSRDFHWHAHEASDEAFLVIEGRLWSDLEHETLELRPAQMVTIPRGTRHRTRADGRVVNLTFELEGTEVTGDRVHGRTG